MIIKFLCCEYFSQKEKEIKLLLWDKFNIHTRPALKKKKKKDLLWASQGTKETNWGDNEVDSCETKQTKQEINLYVFSEFQSNETEYCQVTGKCRLILK